MCIKISKNCNKFYIFGLLAPNSQSIHSLTVMQHCVNQMTLKNVDEFKK